MAVAALVAFGAPVLACGGGGDSSGSSSGSMLMNGDVGACVPNHGGCSVDANCAAIDNGAVVCTCKPGYEGDGKTCTDIDECATNGGGCAIDAICTNTPGSRTCACKPGFMGDGMTCADIDECATNNGGCDAKAKCTNVIGSRTCTCPMGYGGDGVTCTDIDECATMSSNCDPAPRGTCTNTVGSFTCGCGASFKLMADGHTCGGLFDGTTGSTWEPLAAALDYGEALLAYRPMAVQKLYNFLGSNTGNYGQVYDIAMNTWSQLPNVMPYTQNYYGGAAYAAGKIWLLRNNNVYAFNVADSTWTNPKSGIGSDDYSMTESDEYGHLYAHVSSGAIIEYDPVMNAFATYSDGKASLFETRLGYDPGTRAIYFGAYGSPSLFKMDLYTHVVTARTSHPESQLSDIFCSDRSGHIYAAGGSSGTTIWKYDIAGDAWSRIPDLPVDQSNTGTCSVSEDGYLYVLTGVNKAFYRLRLN
jgi:hypothetical protein